MISKIVIDKIASYKKPATLETDKKINIIYGLNGSGKTTISDFLYFRNDHKFANCSVNVPDNELLLVYNTSFIQDYFYKKPNQDGIFTLSKENKASEENIRVTREKINKLEMKKKEKDEHRNTILTASVTQKENAEVKIWEIKTKYTGGDRVLEYCLEGLKSKKNTLFDYICGVNKLTSLPTKTIDELKKEVALLKDNTGVKYDLLPKIKFDFNEMEKDEIFTKIIVGNENSIVAGLIKKLNNADWVKLGLKYLPDINTIEENSTKCPFCQQETITKELFNSINNYFDEEYEKKINYIRGIFYEYTNSFSAIVKAEYEKNPFIDEVKSEFDKIIDSIINCFEKNIKIIQEKISAPSQIYSLNDSYPLIAKFNSFIDEINKKIEDHNYKIDNRQQALSDIKIMFWKIMRFNYDSIISNYLFNENETQKKIEIVDNEIKNINAEIEKQMQIIQTEQKKTVNIDEAIENINNNLLELGMDNFKISKYQDNYYKIIRDDMSENTFSTLSEGEKMIISFLYFIELCKGKKEITETKNKKIIVIDDPISSLSHIYVFNIGEFIKRIFCNSTQFEQIFILTHSLYFFYEMVLLDHEKRKEKQKLFRIIKNKDGSSISIMSYDEVQNDYQSYWSVINKTDYPYAIQASCMRNIVEYFFGFIEKRDLSSLFQKPNLQNNKFQGFYRYINRESHSIGQNIFDYKEFDYEIFKEALKLLFCENGYKEHYDKMSKVG